MPVSRTSRYFVSCRNYSIWGSSLIIKKDPHEDPDPSHAERHLPVARQPINFIHPIKTWDSQIRGIRIKDLCAPSLPLPASSAAIEIQPPSSHQKRVKPTTGFLCDISTESYERRPGGWLAAYMQIVGICLFRVLPSAKSVMPFDT